MNIYEELNVDTIINASDTYTRIGGSRMSRRTLEAMQEALQTSENCLTPSADESQSGPAMRRHSSPRGRGPAWYSRPVPV